MPSKDTRFDLEVRDDPLFLRTWSGDSYMNPESRIRLRALCSLNRIFFEMSMSVKCKRQSEETPSFTNSW